MGVVTTFPRHLSTLTCVGQVSSFTYVSAGGHPLRSDPTKHHIINVASVSAHRVDPTAAICCATKFAVRALSEGLRQESKQLRVTVVSPPFP